MDEETKKLLIEIRDLQLEQLELARNATIPPWMNWRFGVRHLLIAMTILAVVVAILAAANR